MIDFRFPKDMHEPLDKMSDNERRERSIFGTFFSHEFKLSDVNVINNFLDDNYLQCLISDTMRWLSNN